MEAAQIKSVLESLLFLARQPLSLDELEKTTNLPAATLESCLNELMLEYQSRGMQIIKVAGGYLMGTNPNNADYVQLILKPKEETRLSPQALETLAIVAYKQPITRAEIEKLRGVDSDWVVESLVAKNMVQDLGRSDVVGRPFIYGTTEDFLRHFGLTDLKDLPPLPASEVDQEMAFRSALHETA